MSYGSVFSIYTPSSPLITPYYIRESDNNVLTTLKCLTDLRFVHMWHHMFALIKIQVITTKRITIAVSILGIPGKKRISFIERS